MSLFSWLAALLPPPAIQQSEQPAKRQEGGASKRGPAPPSQPARSEQASSQGQHAGCCSAPSPTPLAVSASQQATGEPVKKLAPDGGGGCLLQWLPAAVAGRGGWWLAAACVATAAAVGLAPGWGCPSLLAAASCCLLALTLFRAVAGWLAGWLECEEGRGRGPSSSKGGGAGWSSKQGGGGGLQGCRQGGLLLSKEEGCPPPPCPFPQPASQRASWH